MKAPCVHVLGLRVLAAGGTLLATGLLASWVAQGRPEPKFRGETLPVWMERLADLDPDVQHVAAYAIGRFGPKASLAVDELLRMIREGETTRAIVPPQSNAAVAAEALGHLKSATSEVIGVLAAQAKKPALISRLHRDEARAAIEALGRLGARAKDAVPDLVLVLERPLHEGIAPLDGIAPLQHDAAKALGDIGSAAGEAIPALEALAKSSDDLVLTMLSREALDKIRSDKPK